MKYFFLSVIFAFISATSYANTDSFIINKGGIRDHSSFGNSSERVHRHHRERVSIDLGGLHIRGDNVVYLRKALRQQRPDLPLRNYRISKVIMVGKTRLGRGTSTLRVGDWWGDAVQIDGTPSAFVSNHPHTFDRVVMHNTAHQAEGPWQVHLRGNFKIKRLVIVLEELAREREGYAKERHQPAWIGGRY